MLKNWNEYALLSGICLILSMALFAYLVNSNFTGVPMGGIFELLLAIVLLFSAPLLAIIGLKESHKKKQKSVLVSAIIFFSSIVLIFVILKKFNFFGLL